MYKQYIMQINNVHKDDGTFNRDRAWTKDRVNAVTHCLNTLSFSTVITYVHSVTLVQQKKEKPNNLLNSFGHYTKQINI